jgi:Zn-dependent M32 family carboxypeptidase
MEHSASFKAIEPFLKEKRRIDHTSAILYYDLATTCGEKGLSDEGDLLDYWAGEEAKLFQNKDFAKAVKEGLADPKASPDGA